MNDFLENASLSFLQMVRHTHKDGHVCDFRNVPRPNNSLGLILEGEADFITKDKTVTVKKGDMIFVPMGCTYHSVWHGVNSVQYTTIHFVFDRNGFFPKNKKFEIQKLSVSDFEKIKDTYFVMFKNWGKEKNEQFTVLSLFYSVIQEAYPQLTCTYVAENDSFVTKAIAYIEEHFKEKILVEDLAKLCNMSVSRFHEGFKKVTGLSPIEYKLRYAVRQAERMLLGEQQFPVEMIADKTGFSSSNYFRECFKKITGKAPTEYRRQMHNVKEHGFSEEQNSGDELSINVPYFFSNVNDVNHAFRIAVADVVTNILRFKDGILEKPKPCFIEGLGYVAPSTRDAAINAWGASGLLFPDVTKNTLYSAVTAFPDGVRVGGEYWDAIVWVSGAYQYYLCTGDKEFLEKAYTISKNSLSYFEETEFDEEKNLFRGGALFLSGVSGYPDRYADHNGSCIISFVEEHPERAYKKGGGIPCMILSTNCIYYNAYRLMNQMAKELNKQRDKSYDEKAEALKNAINTHFWNEEKGTYRYLIDAQGGCDFQEAMGLSLALLLDIANEEQKEKVLNNLYVAPQGIPCLHPSFSRYESEDGASYGRHSGTVWPHIQAFFADCMANIGRVDLMEHELKKITEHAVRDSQFAELYHPVTGLPYGGRQENWRDGFHIKEWAAEERQTSSAIGFLHIILYNVVGMTMERNGITFRPNMVHGINQLELKNIMYRGMQMEISIHGTGKITSFLVNGQKQKNFISKDLTGLVKIEITLEEV